MVPGEGTIDWPPFVEALKDVGYKGVFMLEIYGDEKAEERLSKSYEVALKCLKIRLLMSSCETVFLVYCVW